LSFDVQTTGSSVGWQAQTREQPDAPAQVAMHWLR